jgi:methionyl-tRNA formyltransferase
MRIVLIGQAAFGAKVLQALLDKGELIVGVCIPPDKDTSKIDPLKESAQQHGIPVLQPPRMRDPEVYHDFCMLTPELGVMAFVTDIVPTSILDCPSLGTIQYHPSLLPRHRGGSAINWAIINGETETGITIFWPDGGIDTGPVLLQKHVNISPDDTVGSLYFDKLFPMGVETIVESIDLIKRREAPRIPQDESQATYEGLCRERNSIINWAAPVPEVYNLIRGTNPQPGATTSFRGQKLKIFDCMPIVQDVTGKPGEVVDITSEGISVAAHGGFILIKRVQVPGQPKIGAAEYATTTVMRAGELMGVA